MFSPWSAALAQRLGAGRVIALGLVIVAAGFGLLTTLTPDTPYLLIAVAFAVLGAGMSVTAAPATAEIMTSVPLSKAGVGSAVNDTTRELGGRSASHHGSIVTSRTDRHRTRGMSLRGSRAAAEIRSARGQRRRRGLANGYTLTPGAEA